MPTAPEDPSTNARIWFKPFGFGIMYLLFGGFVFCQLCLTNGHTAKLLNMGRSQQRKFSI
jgi:hypothetical protein